MRCNGNKNIAIKILLYVELGDSFSLAVQKWTDTKVNR